jgi:hypothetical protein
MNFFIILVHYNDQSLCISLINYDKTIRTILVHYNDQSLCISLINYDKTIRTILVHKTDHMYYRS